MARNHHDLQLLKANQQLQTFWHSAAAAAASGGGEKRVVKKTGWKIGVDELKRGSNG